MLSNTKILLVFTSLITLIACAPTVQKNTTDNTFESVIKIHHRDLLTQSKTGNGEGLAKPVPNQPLLVNNQLVFSTMGNAVLGIAMSVGTIKQTIDQLVDMHPLQLEKTLHNVLLVRSKEPEWKTLLTHLKHKGKKLTLEPYGYLNGYPNAVLEVRLHVTLESEDKQHLDKQLTKVSPRSPVSGNDSWSANNGEKIRQFTVDAMPTLVEQLQTLLLNYEGNTY